MNRALVGVCVLLCLSAALAEEKAAKVELVAITVEVSQVEVNVAKLKKMGIDWDAVAKHEKDAGKVGWLRSFTHLLVENDLASMQAHPQLMTMSGREATIHIGGMKERILPKFVEGQIELAVSLELSDPPSAERLAEDTEAAGEVRSFTSTKTTCKPGEARLIGETRSTGHNSRGEVTEDKATLVFVLADIVRPEAPKVKGPLPADAEYRATGGSSAAAKEQYQEVLPRRKR